SALRYGRRPRLSPSPTRRSSDLKAESSEVDTNQRHISAAVGDGARGIEQRAVTAKGDDDIGGRRQCVAVDDGPARIRTGKAGGRSEEHTSELQSRENLVCRLLLE